MTFPSKAILIGAALASLAVTTNANAFGINSCDIYGRIATHQQAQNLQTGCGFQGLRWHSSTAAHQIFCQSVGVEIARIGTLDRANDLKACHARNNRFGNNELIIVPAIRQ